MAKKPKMAPYRPEEQAYLQRWKGVKNQHPTLWEKMDKDPVYDTAIKNRDLSNDGTSLGTQWGVGRPKGPN
jgi:hypothetical protein